MEPQKEYVDGGSSKLNPDLNGELRSPMAESGLSRILDDRVKNIKDLIEDMEMGSNFMEVNLERIELIEMMLRSVIIDGDFHLYKQDFVMFDEALRKKLKSNHVDESEGVIENRNNVDEYRKYKPWFNSSDLLRGRSVLAAAFSATKCVVRLNTGTSLHWNPSYPKDVSRAMNGSMKVKPSKNTSSQAVLSVCGFVKDENLKKCLIAESRMNSIHFLKSKEKKNVRQIYGLEIEEMMMDVGKTLGSESGNLRTYRMTSDLLKLKPNEIVKYRSGVNDFIAEPGPAEDQKLNSADPSKLYSSMCTRKNKTVMCINMSKLKKCNHIFGFLVEYGPSSYSEVTNGDSWYPPCLCEFDNSGLVQNKMVSPIVRDRLLEKLEIYEFNCLAILHSLHEMSVFRMNNKMRWFMDLMPEEWISRTVLTDVRPILNWAASTLMRVVDFVRLGWDSMIWNDEEYPESLGDRKPNEKATGFLTTVVSLIFIAYKGLCSKNEGHWRWFSNYENNILIELAKLNIVHSEAILPTYAMTDYSTCMFWNDVAELFSDSFSFPPIEFSVVETKDIAICMGSMVNDLPFWNNTIAFKYPVGLVQPVTDGSNHFLYTSTKPMNCVKELTEIHCRITNLKPISSRNLRTMGIGYEKCGEKCVELEREGQRKRISPIDSDVLFNEVMKFIRSFKQVREPTEENTESWKLFDRDNFIRPGRWVSTHSRNSTSFDTQDVSQRERYQIFTDFDMSDLGDKKMYTGSEKEKIEEAIKLKAVAPFRNLINPMLKIAECDGYYDLPMVDNIVPVTDPKHTEVKIFRAECERRGKNHKFMIEQLEGYKELIALGNSLTTMCFNRLEAIFHLKRSMKLQEQIIEGDFDGVRVSKNLFFVSDCTTLFEYVDILRERYNNCLEEMLRMMLEGLKREAYDLVYMADQDYIDFFGNPMEKTATTDYDKLPLKARDLIFTLGEYNVLVEKSAMTSNKELTKRMKGWNTFKYRSNLNV